LQVKQWKRLFAERGHRRAPFELARWLAVPVTVFLAFAVRAAIEAAGFGPLPIFITAYPAVMLVGVLAGAPAGVATTVVATLVAAFILPPRGHLHVANPSDLVALLMFVGNCLVMTGAVHLYWRARSRAVALASELALGKATDRYTRALEIAGAGAWEWDLRTNENFWSEAVWRLYGLSPGQARPSFEAWLATVAPEDREAVSAAVRSAASESKPIRVEWRVSAGEGEERWLLSHGDPILGTDGRAEQYAGIVLDVTASKRARELTLRANEIRLRARFEQAAVGMVKLDEVTGRFLDVNAKFCEMLGYSREELLARTLQEFTQLDERGVGREGFGRLLEPGAEYRQETRFLRKDGTVLWGAVAANRTALIGERPGTVFAEVEDVTDRKVAESALERTRQLMAEGERIAGIGAWEYIAATTETVWSEGECRIYGVDPREKSPDYGRMLRERIHPDDAEAVDRTFRQALENRGTYVMEHRVVRPDGSQRVVRDLAHPHLDDAGQLVKYVGISLDVTDRLKAEKEIRASEQRFRDVAAAADEYIFEMTPAGEVSYVSDAVESVLGHRAEEIIGKNMLAFLGPEERERAAGYLAEHAARRERISHFQLEAMHRNGKPVWLDISAVPVLGDEGALLGYRGAVLDVTERHLAEQERSALQTQLAQSQKLESVGRLAGGVAHDFNNILSVILSYAGFVQEELKEGDPIRAEMLEIERSAERAAALTRQLLAFSRRQVLQPVPLDLNQLVGGMEKMLRRIIGEDVHLVLRLAPDLGIVKADPGQMEQVIMNIAVNARDAMPKGGTLTIETGDVDLDEESVSQPVGAKSDPHVMISITDSGTGMDEQTKARIFEPFFTTKEPGSGTGLGLSTVYGIVKQSGGSISVHSEIGQGTTFKVLLPRETSGVVAPTSHLPGRTGVSERRRTILLVEDEAMVRDAARRILSGAGYTVIEAGSGEEGLAAGERHVGTIDLLLTDVVMPGIGGKTVAERLARVRPGTKVLFMSGYTDDAIVNHGVLEPGTQFLAKPFTHASLLAKVREMLEPERHRASPGLQAEPGP
jgi:two-component system, cell cycle sensor histidine kinase and response regulator CckA